MPLERGVRSVGVVLESVLLSQQLGLLHRGEQLIIQELVPEPAVERFHKGVLPGRSRWNVGVVQPLLLHHSCKALA